MKYFKIMSKENDLFSFDYDNLENNTFIDSEPFIPSELDELIQKSSYVDKKETEGALDWVDGNLKFDSKTIKNDNVEKEFKSIDDVLNHFFPERFIDYIYGQTNKSIKKLREKDKEISYVTIPEIYIFFGLLYYMGVDNLPNLKCYWIKGKDQPLDLRRSYVYNKMTYSRFLFIRGHFRLTAHGLNEYTFNNKIEQKTTDLFSSVNITLQTGLNPEKCISIDESTVVLRVNVRLWFIIRLNQINGGSKYMKYLQQVLDMLIKLCFTQARVFLLIQLLIF